MPTRLTSDPLIERAHELLRKFPPKADEPSLWLKPPINVDAPPNDFARFWHPLSSEHMDLKGLGWQSLDETSPSDLWGAIVLYGGKHKDENWELLKTANECLHPNGILHFVVPNEYGSKSYQKTLESDERLVEHQTGRKSRLYLLRKGPTSGEMRDFGALCQNPEGYWSNPGLFSWSRVDRGSRVLADVLKQAELSGPIADLGAGWGYLGTQLDPTLTLHLFENDQRGTAASRQNLDRPNVVTHWCDLCQPNPWPQNALKSYRTIITNPPFHVGRKEQSLLSHHFTALAHRLLKPHGDFYLVGNTHLAYPRLLKELFASVEILLQRDGFSVILSKEPK